MDGELITAIEAATQSFGEHQAAVAASLSKIDTRMSDVEKRFARMSDEPNASGTRGTSWGAALTADSAFKTIGSDGRGTARVKVQNAITTASDSGGALTPEDKRTDPIPLVRRRLTILDLITQSETSAPSVKIARAKTRTNNADIAPETTLKGESAYDFEVFTVDILTIAHWTAASKQIMDDAPQLQSLIDGELRYGLGDRLEREILSGPGGSERFTGLLTAATAFNAPFTAAMENRLDRILAAKAQLEADDYTATGIVVNATDWSIMVGEKDADGRYLSGGPFQATSPQLWGLPVVASTLLPANTFMVGDFRRAATLYSRQEATVEVSTEHADFFTKNLVAVRGELRAGLAINDGAAIIKGELVEI